MRRGRTDATSSDFTLTVISNSGATVAPVVRNCSCDECHRKIAKKTDAVLWLKRSKAICAKCALHYLKCGNLLSHADRDTGYGHSDEGILQLMQSGPLGRLAVTAHANSFLINADTRHWAGTTEIRLSKPLLSVFSLLFKSVVCEGQGLQSALIRLLSRRSLLDILNNNPVVAEHVLNLLHNSERELQLGVLNVLSSVTWGRKDKLKLLSAIENTRDPAISKALNALLSKLGIQNEVELQKAAKCQSYVDFLMDFYKPEGIRIIHAFIFRYVPGSSGSSKCTILAYEIVKATLEEPDIKRLFFALPSATQKLIRTLIWRRVPMTDVGIKRKLGLTTSGRVKSNSWFREYYIDVAEEYCGLLELINLNSDHAGVTITRWLAERFKLLIPKPKISFSGSAKPPGMPEGNLMEYNPDFVALLPNLHNRLRNKMIDLKRNGLPSVAGCRKMAAFGGEYKEFYPDDRSLRHLRSELLFRIFGQSVIPDDEELTSPVIAKALLATLFDPSYKTEFVESTVTFGYINHNIIPKLMPHLEWGYFKHYEKFTGEYLDSLFYLVSTMPKDRWFTVEETLDYLFLSGKGLGSSAIIHIVNPNVVDSRGSNKYTHINPLNVAVLWEEPLVKSFVLLLAAVGAMEVVCKEPVNEEVCAYDRKYLSRADGVAAFRLSPLGKWYFQKGDESCFKKIEPGKVVLDDKRLLLQLQGNDIALKTAIEQTATPVGEGFYSVESGSFLRECSTEEAVRHKISSFKALLPEELPGVWREFFESTLARLNPFKHVKTCYTILELKDSPELKRLLLSTEKLRKLVTLAEGGLILVPHKKIRTLKKALADLGFYVDVF